MSTVTVTTLDAGIARIAIDRPDKRNAIDPDTRTEMIAALAGALAEPAIHAIILTGEGGHFCAGGDITSMGDFDVATARIRMKHNHRLVRALMEAEKPVIAAVEGFAVGAGAGLALLCDFIVLAEGGSIGFPFFKIGLTPDYGILHTLPRRVGAAAARRLLFSAATLKGAEALDAGLADELVGEGEAERRALEIALEMAALPPHAFALTKRHLAMGPMTLDGALELEALAMSLAFTGPELVEGRAAFAEKRKPDFR